MHLVRLADRNYVQHRGNSCANAAYTACLAALHTLRGSFPVFAGDEKCVNFLAVCPPGGGNNIAAGSMLHQAVVRIEFYRPATQIPRICVSDDNELCDTRCSISALSLHCSIPTTFLPVPQDIKYSDHIHAAISRECMPDKTTSFQSNIKTRSTHDTTETRHAWKPCSTRINGSLAPLNKTELLKLYVYSRLVSK